MNSRNVTAGLAKFKPLKVKMAKPLSSLALRLISSAILIPVVVGIIILGGWAFAGLVGACIAIAIAEWVTISRHIHISTSAKALLIASGFSYLGLSFIEMITLRMQLDGAYWTILFMLVIWASDSVAYAFGKGFGGPKMTPTISPNKTWSGYAGALIGPAAVLVIAVHILTPEPLIGLTPPVLHTAIAGVFIGITGQAGDLMISFLKRKAAMKDTGHLIPGHGGILDRIDALLLALPVYLAYVEYVVE